MFGWQCRPQQVNNGEFNNNWDKFEDNLGGDGGQNENEGGCHMHSSKMCSLLWILQL